MSDAARRIGPVLEAHFQFLLWLVPTVDRFPKSQKFVLGDRLQNAALDILEYVAPAPRDLQGRPVRSGLSREA